MDINLRELYLLSEAMEFASQSISEAKLSPPPNMPDIKQVLIAEGRARLLSAEGAHGRILMDGTVVYSVCYLSETGSCESFSATAAFKTAMEAPGVLPDSIINATVCVSDTECVQGGPREVYLKSIVEISATAMNNEKVLTLDAADKNIITKNTKKRICCIREIKTRVLPIREDIKLICEAADVVFTTGYVRNLSYIFDERSCCVSGEIVANILLLTGDEASPLCVQNTALPFEQMFIMDSYEDGDNARIEAHIDEINVSVIEGEKYVGCLEAILNLKVILSTAKSESIICDAYSQKSVIEVSKKVYRHTCDSFNTGAAKDAVFSHDLQGVNDAGEVHVMVKPFVLWKECTDDALSLEGSADIFVFYMRNGQIACTKLESPFAYELPVLGLSADSKAHVKCGLRNATAEISGGKLNVNANLDFGIQVFNGENLELAYAATDTGVPIEREPGIFIYFANGSDSTFDVAKKYLTTEDEIVNLNPDISDTLYAGQKVLIVAS